MSSFSGKLTLAVLAGFAVFFFLVGLGIYETRTGIEQGASPTAAIIGAAVLGGLSHKLSTGLELSRGMVIVFWFAFLLAGSLAVWVASGSQDLGPAGDGFHRYFEVMLSVFFPFGFGVLCRIVAKAA
jgi:hypothetical protein